MDDLKCQNRHLILNSYGWFILIINLAFFIVNTVALCVNFPSKENLSFDYMGVIVGILSILVTILLGWQIFINISMERKVDEKLKEVSKELKAEIKETGDIVKSEIENKKHASIALSLYQSSCSAYILKKYDFALWLALDAMIHCNKIDDKDSAFQNNEFENIIDSINKCMQMVSKVTFLSSDKIKECISCASEMGLYEIAYYLRHNAVDNKNDSTNYITNMCSDELDESKINSKSIGNGNSFFEK